MSRGKSEEVFPIVPLPYDWDNIPRAFREALQTCRALSGLDDQLGETVRETRFYGYGAARISIDASGHISWDHIQSSALMAGDPGRRAEAPRSEDGSPSVSGLPEGS